MLMLCLRCFPVYRVQSYCAGPDEDFGSSLDLWYGVILHELIWLFGSVKQQDLLCLGNWDRCHGLWNGGDGVDRFRIAVGCGLSLLSRKSAKYCPSIHYRIIKVCV